MAIYKIEILIYMWISDQILLTVSELLLQYFHLCDKNPV